MLGGEGRGGKGRAMTVGISDVEGGWVLGLRPCCEFVCVCVDGLG